MGAILCQGARRISSILHVMGIADRQGFERYHRFLNRDQWSPLLGAKILLGLLIAIVPNHQTLIVVLDEAIERRKGKNIKAKGCYRDAVRQLYSSPEERPLGKRGRRAMKGKRIEALKSMLENKSLIWQKVAWVFIFIVFNCHSTHCSQPSLFIYYIREISL